MSRWGHCVQRYYELLVHCYPQAFRHEYGPLLLDGFEREWSAAMGSWLKFTLLTRSTVDVVRSSLQERNGRTSVSMVGVLCIGIVLSFSGQFIVGLIARHLTPHYNAIVYQCISVLVCLALAPALASLLGLQRFGFATALMTTLIYWTVGQYWVSWLSNSVWLNARMLWVAVAIPGFDHYFSVFMLCWNFILETLLYSLFVWCCCYLARSLEKCIVKRREYNE